MTCLGVVVSNALPSYSFEPNFRGEKGKCLFFLGIWLRSRLSMESLDSEHHTSSHHLTSTNRRLSWSFAVIKAYLGHDSPWTRKKTALIRTTWQLVPERGTSAGRNRFSGHRRPRQRGKLLAHVTNQLHKPMKRAQRKSPRPSAI